MFAPGVPPQSPFPAPNIAQNGNFQATQSTKSYFGFWRWFQLGLTIGLLAVWDLFSTGLILALKWPLNWLELGSARNV